MKEVKNCLDCRHIFYNKDKSEWYCEVDFTKELADKTATAEKCNDFTYCWM